MRKPSGISLQASGAAAALVLALGACAHSEFALRPVSAIAADNVGKPIGRLQDALGAPRKVEETQGKRIFVWFIEQRPPGAPAGFHGCEVEVTVGVHSDAVLGYSLSNIGWSNCHEVERKIRVAER